MTDRSPSVEDPRMTAAIDMLGRTGATQMQLRYSDDEQPVVWFAVGVWEKDGRTVYETASALHPLTALLRLLDTAIDGGECAHCHKPVGVDSDEQPTDLPFKHMICWYQYDPELRTFRRGCA